MNGFEDMDTVVAMTHEDMRSMGILPPSYGGDLGPRVGV